MKRVALLVLIMLSVPMVATAGAKPPPPSQTVTLSCTVSAGVSFTWSGTRYGSSVIWHQGSISWTSSTPPMSLTTEIRDLEDHYVASFYFDNFSGTSGTYVQNFFNVSSDYRSSVVAGWADAIDNHEKCEEFVW